MSKFELPKGLRELTHAEVRDLNEGDKIHVYLVSKDHPEINQVIEAGVKEVDENDENRTVLFEIDRLLAREIFEENGSETLGGPFDADYCCYPSGWTCKLEYFNKGLRNDAFIPVEVLESYEVTKPQEVVADKIPETFKVGDYVYFPRAGLEVFKLRANGGASYPIECADFTFTESGRILKEDCVPAIWHATEENRKKLEAMFGVEFAKPTNEKILALQKHHKDGAIFLLTASSMKPANIFNLGKAEFVQIKEISSKLIEYSDGYGQPITEDFLENLHAVELTKNGEIVYL